MKRVSLHPKYYCSLCSDVSLMYPCLLSPWVVGLRGSLYTVENIISLSFGLFANIAMSLTCKLFVRFLSFTHCFA